MQAPERTTVRGPTFIRLIARLSRAPAPQPGGSLPDRLSRWLAWSHAIALSTALDGKLPEAPEDAPLFGSAVEDECVRARAQLAQAIVTGREPVAVPARGGQVPAADAPPEYVVFRQRYLTMQRAMQAATGRLRGDLRDMLAGRSPDMGRLAEVDAVMERSLSPLEHGLLANVPILLAERFERLRRLAPEDSLAWVDVFRKDMQSVLLAELDVRFQPIEGLLAALRAS